MNIPVLLDVADKGADMGLFRALSNAIFKEYDRRIRRASLITEYGASHHHNDHDHHDDHGEHAVEHADHDAEPAEIVNLPRGTPIVAPAAPPQEQE
jgi:hypothetical protein